MYNFKYHYKNNIKHDFLVKYNYKHLYFVPKFNSPDNNFGSKALFPQ